MKYKIVPLVFALLLISCGALFAADLTETVALHQESLDMIWLLLTATMVFSMQAGFAMVELGLTRAKNAGNIIMKNLMDFCFGALVFWAVWNGR